jgi:hypothetical protein
MICVPGSYQHAPCPNPVSSLHHQFKVVEVISHHSTNVQFGINCPHISHSIAACSPVSIANSQQFSTGRSLCSGVVRSTRGS